jgi:hypothetical protein
MQIVRVLLNSCIRVCALAGGRYWRRAGVRQVRHAGAESISRDRAYALIRLSVPRIFWTSLYHLPMPALPALPLINESTTECYWNKVRVLKPYWLTNALIA